MTLIQLGKSTASARNHSMKNNLLWILIGLITFTQAENRKPNIIVIIGDDVGYGDFSANGSSAISTPHMDRLAKEGIRFTSGYCSASTCTPTRYSLHTGVYAFREKNTGIAPPDGPAIIPANTVTVASLLKDAGYRTAAIGKWHLGLGENRPDWNGELKPGPLEIGYDQCLLLPTTNDRVPQVYVENHRVRNLDPQDPLWIGKEKPSPDHPTGVTHRDTLFMDWSHDHNQTIHNGVSRIGFYTGGKAARFRDQDLTDEWVKSCHQFITENKNQPFFLYYASHSIHVPRLPHERFLGKSGHGPRGDSLLEFDWSVGEIMKAVEDNKLSNDTLIILCSDNGPVLDDGYKDDAVTKLGKHQPSGPFRGGKYSVFEGGTRTPFITRWSGKIKPAVSDAPVSTVDFAASFAALAGISVPQGACRDSVNILPNLLGETNSPIRDHILQQDNNGKAFGLRVGAWKLVREKMDKQSQLYNLKQDPQEKNNLAQSNPEQLKIMNDRLEQILAKKK